MAQKRYTKEEIQMTNNYVEKTHHIVYVCKINDVLRNVHENNKPSISKDLNVIAGILVGMESGD